MVPEDCDIRRPETAVLLSDWTTRYRPDRPLP